MAPILSMSLQRAEAEREREPMSEDALSEAMCRPLESRNDDERREIEEREARFAEARGRREAQTLFLDREIGPKAPKEHAATAPANAVSFEM
jgi:hypothetical protein